MSIAIMLLGNIKGTIYGVIFLFLPNLLFIFFESIISILWLKFSNNVSKDKNLYNIKGKISNLGYFPYAHKLLRKTRNFEYRKFIIKNYIIIYKINLKEKEVNILHIYNQKQKIKNKKEYSQV